MTDQDKVWQRGNGAESRARALRADQELYISILESNSEPERARVSQRVAVKASGSQSGSHREPQRASKSLGEPAKPEGAELGSQRAI